MSTRILILNLNIKFTYCEVDLSCDKENVFKKIGENKDK